MEQSLIEEKKSKEETTVVNKKKRKRELEKGKCKAKLNSHEYVEMEPAEALNRDNGFDGDFSSVSERKACDMNVAVGAELDQKKGKKKRKKDAVELEELDDGGFVTGEVNGGSVSESEHKIKLDKKEWKKKERKKKEKRADNDAMEVEVRGEENVCESDDKTKLDKEEKKKKKKAKQNGCEPEDKSKLDKKEGKKKADELGELGGENGGSVCESEDKTKSDKKERKKKRKIADADKGAMKLEKQDNDGEVCESKKCSVTLEEGKQVDMSKGEDKKREGKKKRKQSGNVAQGIGQDTLIAGDVKNGNKEAKKIKNKNESGIMRKGKEVQRKDKGKRVSFTDAVEVFDDGVHDEESGEGSGSELVHGKRFTEEEDATIMEALVKYAEMKQLGEKGLEMIRSCNKHPELKGCWAQIAKALPHRPQMAVYKRARILLYRSDTRKWTEEEYEIVRRFVQTNGTNWKNLALALGKSEIHVKDTWRRIKPINLRRGPWTQEEYQNLFDLVNLDLRIKAHQEFEHGHRNIKENISWEAISDKLTTRTYYDCCLKWYRQLASPLVKEGSWADSDDYRLVEALQKVDAVCLEDVDWDNLLDHRSGELCRKRWNQMVRLLGEHREKPFIEQVEVLARRYSIDMIDYRK